MKLKIFYQDNNNIKSIVLKEYNLNKFPHNIIKIEKVKYLKDYFNISFNSYNDVINIFKELNMILQNDISLDEAIDILLNGNHIDKINEILYTIRNALKNAQPINESLEKYKNYIGSLPILFFKIGIQNGNIKESIDALCIILEKNTRIKKQFFNAINYPIILLIALSISIGLIFSFVLPRFEHIFIQFGSNLPVTTKSLLYMKYFFTNHFIFIISSFALIVFATKYSYHKYKISFEKFIINNIPIIGKLYREFILYKFFLVLSMLVKSNSQFQISLENSKIILDNRYILSKINQIIIDIQNGHTVSNAFFNTKLFDDTAIHLLNISQKTNTLSAVINNIVIIYQENLNDKIKKISNAVGPIFILVISVFMLWIILAIMQPIWEIGTVLK